MDFAIVAQHSPLILWFMVYFSRIINHGRLIESAFRLANAMDIVGDLPK